MNTAYACEAELTELGGEDEGGEYVLVEGQALQEKRTLIEELAYKVKNMEHQLDYELDVSRANFEK